MSSKLTSWRDMKKKMTSLSQEELDEIDLKVQIVGEILKARQEESLTQRALEEISGVKQPMIARIEGGDTDPQLSTVIKILRPLGKKLAVVDMEYSD
ncbi:MAG: helix-turn-helix domain-containing protein [Clostridiales bacterium]|jgi:DNA-binding XRE family transcriptional regulator|nr:helix-turn-helix domain-containing protein [Clostridiales bacterium]